MLVCSYLAVSIAIFLETLALKEGLGERLIPLSFRGLKDELLLDGALVE